MNERRFHILLSLIMLVIGLGASMWFLNSLRADQAPQAEPWPPFMMVYTDWGAHRGLNGTPGFVRARIIYQDSRHWRSEIIEDSVMPSYAGSFTEFNGKQLSGFNATFNHSATVDEPNSPKLAPDDWLLPGQISYLKRQPGISSRPGTKPGLEQLVKSEAIPCDPDVAQCDKAMRDVVTEILYDSKYELPMGLTVYSDKQKSRQVTVEEFSWITPSQ
jgi:hypothetical protein